MKKKISKIQKNKENDEKQINENIQTIEETKKNIINKSKNNENLNKENNNLNLKEPLQLTKQVSQHIDPILIKKPTDISELLNNYFTKSKNKNDNLKLEEINNILNNKTNTEKIIIIFDVIKNTLYKKEKIKHFLEFYFSLNKNNLEKININFFENLNLNNYIQYNNTGANYKLIGVITHMGESGMSGHFIAYCLDPISGLWHKYNDAIVTPVNNFQSEVINYAMPYLLFYQKVQ